MVSNPNFSFHFYINFVKFNLFKVNLAKFKLT
jgi:hypothetical protein